MHVFVIRFILDPVSENSTVFVCQPYGLAHAVASSLLSMTSRRAVDVHHVTGLHVN